MQAGVVDGHFRGGRNTEVTYIWNGELLGDYPNFYLQTAWKTGGIEIMQELRQAIENKNK